jgi:hypothetical protein
MRSIYVLGRGHSGSTILDILLGCAPDVESVGGLAADIGRPDAVCSCGETIRDCPFWSAVRVGAEQRAGEPWEALVEGMDAASHLRHFPRVAFAPIGDERNRRAFRASRAVMEAIADVAGTGWVVDSSKEPTRAMLIGRHDDDAVIVHLLRHPVGVLKSVYWRLRAGVPFKMLRRRVEVDGVLFPYMAVVTVSWLVGFVLAGLVRLRARGRVHTIWFEDLLGQPRAEILRLGEAAGMDVSEVIRRLDAGEPFQVGHNIGGNRIRHQRELTFRPDPEQGRDLPLRYRALANLICWPVLLFAGPRTKR